LTRRILAARVGSVLLAIVIAGCGSTPAGPGPVTPLPTQPAPAPTVNVPPTIDSIAIGVERAEVGDDVTVTATVHDPETAITDLQFAWSADAGTFSGEGATVKWRPPSEGATPADFTMRLTVTETYGVADASGVRPKNVVSATSAGSVRVHNSPREIGDMSLGFLRDFANSAIPADVAVRDFSDTCPGKAEERGNVADNRIHYEVLSASLSLVNSGAAASRLTGNAKVACEFSSLVKACQADRPTCKVGSVEKVKGDCVLTTVYQQRRWWLCDSHFENGVNVPLARAFFGEHR
jgi:hypothetical protein